MNSYRLTLSCDADDVSGAIREFIGRLSEDTAANLIEYLGSYHPDGELRTCAPPPSGYALLEVTSSYYGSHEEYGEGDRDYFFAIPAGAEAPEVRLTHGHYGEHSEELNKLPEGALEWNGTEWVPFLRTRSA